jgi:hypothetical protein
MASYRVSLLSSFGERQREGERGDRLEHKYSCMRAGTPAGMSLTKMCLAGNNLLITGSGRVWYVTSRLDGKIDNLFYSVSGRFPSTYSLVCGKS